MDSKTVTCTFPEILFFQSLLIVQRLEKCLASGSFKSNGNYKMINTQLKESIMYQANQHFKA